MLVWEYFPVSSINLSGMHSRGWSQVLGSLRIANAFTIDCVFAGMSYPQASIEACGRSRGGVKWRRKGFRHRMHRRNLMCGRSDSCTSFLWCPTTTSSSLCAFVKTDGLRKNFRHRPLHCDRCRVQHCNKCVVQYKVIWLERVAWDFVQYFSAMEKRKWWGMQVVS